jgi:hypothetical protein
MGLFILQDAAAAEQEWGDRLASDDSDFAVPLRKALAAIQATMLKVQEDPVCELGVFAVGDETVGTHIRGGDVCLTHLMAEVKNFARFITST